MVLLLETFWAQPGVISWKIGCSRSSSSSFFLGDIKGSTMVWTVPWVMYYQHWWLGFKSQSSQMCTIKFHQSLYVTVWYILLSNEQTSLRTSTNMFCLKCCLLTNSVVIFLSQVFCAGSGVVRIDPLRFLAGCLARRLNQALSVLSLSLHFFECVCCAVN